MRDALRIDRAAYGDDHPRVAICLSNLAQLLKDMSRLAEAEPLMWEAFRIDCAAYGDNHPRVADGLSNLAQFLLIYVPSARSAHNRAIRRILFWLKGVAPITRLTAIWAIAAIAVPAVRSAPLTGIHPGTPLGPTLAPKLPSCFDRLSQPTERDRTSTGTIHRSIRYRSWQRSRGLEHGGCQFWSCCAPGCGCAARASHAASATPKFPCRHAEPPLDKSKQ